MVRRRLGSGGFATVWLAYDDKLDAEVAVKVLADNWADDETVRRRFLEEGRFLRRVESAHVVQVHDVGELEDGRPFLVLMYADRGTLADRIREKPLDLEQAVDVVVQIGRGLQALHRRGMLHRDVKPANVLFRSTDDGERAVLSDLGLGKSLDETSRITMPGGTPSYVAPEQALGERLDPRADQYSLGAVAYAALTGKSPHQVEGLAAASRVSAPSSPSELGFAVPDRIEQAILRALEPNRDDRWPDVETFTRELVGGLNETTRSFETEPVAVAGADSDSERTIDTATKPPTIAPAADLPTELPAAAPRRRRARWVVAAVLATAVGAAGGFVGQRLTNPDRVIERNGFSVTVPRDWDVAATGGPSPYEAAIRVSAEQGWDGRASAVSGVFVGLLPGAELPAMLPDAGAHCQQRDGWPHERGRRTQVSRGCAGVGTVLLDRQISTSNRMRLHIQVRAPDEKTAIEVADSVHYPAGGI